MAAGDKKPATPRDAATRAEIIASTRKSMLVEAAAGTGKTTLIVDRILQGVCDGTLRLANAVAITFTERAAGELESRLRARLAAELYRYDPASVERSRIQAAIEELDRANLSTIHAFCARILREKAAEAGVDPEFAVLEATAADVLRERCWREWMDAQVAAGADPLVDALRAGVSVADLKEIAVALTNAPEVLEAPRFGLPAPAQSREHSVAALRDLAPEAADILREHMTGRGNEHSRKLRRLASSMAAAGPDDVGTLRRLAYAVAGVPVENALTSISRDVRDEAARVFSDLRTAAMGLGAHLSEAVFHWLAGFLEHYRQAKLSRSVLDFQDLLLLTARVLRDNLAVRRYFQRRFDAFFVDEFQDTDPLQAELIAYLCEDGTGPAAGAMELVRLADGKLFAVGDPKQSIYRFRRADVQVYDRFKGLLGVEAFGEDRTRQIFCNFRSVTPLLGFSNAVFGRLFEQPAETGIYQARHVPLEPPVTPDLPSPAGACVMAVCPPPDVSTLEWNLPVARRCEARVLARIISAAVAGDLSALEDGFSYGDFAMLFRVLTDVSIYEEALDDCGIPYRVIGGKHFYRREQVVETLALLQAVEDPLNEAAVVGALRSSFFGFSDEELFRYREGGGQWNYLLPSSKPGAVGQAMQTLAAWHRRRTSVPPHVLLHQVFDHTKVLQTFLLKPAGRQRVANLEKLSNQLRSLWKATGTFGAVVRHLSAIHEAELPEEESSVVEPGDDLVRIMSMHKAKGLQFRAVVLPDLAREFTGVRGVGHLLFNRLDGRVGLRVAAGIESENYQELAGEELGNQLAEQRRLLYVACTRAQRLLILPLHWSLKGRGGSMQQLLAESGVFAAPPEVPMGVLKDGINYVDTTAWLEAAKPGVTPRQPPEGEGEEVGPLLAAREEWAESHRLRAHRASVGELFVLPSSLETGFELRHTAEETPRGAGGRDFGSLFHNVMVNVPLETSPRDDAERLIRHLALVEGEAMGADETAAREAADLALAAVKNVEFRALIEAATWVKKEADFAVPLASLPICPEDALGLLEGSIDLLVRAGGRTTVLDYKTDRFELRARPSVEERYWPQLALYALAAQACGRAGADVDLALFFVRVGAISRRRLDQPLLDHVAAQVARAVAEAGK